METVLLKKGFWSTLILLSILLLSTLTFSKSVLAHNHVSGHRMNAVIYSDRSDYQPGDTLRLSGSGFQPGETVTLHFDETPTVCANGHNRSAIADANGNIFYDQFYFNDRHLGVTFIVTATGQSSGSTAQTTFTDGLLFTATISSSPSPVCSGGNATYTMVITNLTTAPPTGNNARLGSARIVIPSGFTSVSISSISLPTRFSASIVSGNIQVSRTGGAGNSLGAGSPGESLTVVFTAIAPSVISNPYVFTTTAWVGNDFATTQYPALVNQPQINLNEGPIITAANLPTSGIIANQTGTCGASVTLGDNVSATGNPAPTVSYSLTNFGSPISNPYVFPVGVTTVYVRAANDCGSDIKSFTVTVTDNEAPIAPTLSDVEGECSAEVSVPSANDNCEGVIQGTTSDPLSYSTQGTHVIHWSFDDGNGNVSYADQNVIIDDVTAPVAPTLSDVEGECSAEASVPSATDNCAGLIQGTTSDPLSYSTQGTHVIHWSFDDGNGNVSYADQNVIIDDITAPEAPTLSDVEGECSAEASVPSANDNCEGSILGTTSDPLSYSTQGTHVIHWSFDDGNGNVSYADQNVIIDDVTAPVAPTLSDVEGECSAEASVPSANDNCEDVIQGTTSDPLSYSTQGTHVIHWSFDDGNGNVSYANQNVIIDDVTAPVVPTLADVEGECSAEASVPSANDNCEDVIQGTTSDPLSYSTQGTHVIHWSFDDGNGNVSYADQNVIIDDITAPEAPTLSDVEGECSAEASVPSANDNCEGAIQGTTSDPLSYSTQGTHVIHWSFDDDNGNVSYADQNVIIDDITAPEAPTLSDVEGECSAEASVPSANDNCEGSILGTTSDPLSYSTQGTHVIHWSFDDGNGNVSYADQNVIIDDITAPEAPTLSDVEGECSAEASVPSANDNCEGLIQGTTSDPLSYSTQGTHVIHWSFDDGNGNVSYANQNVIIDDVTAPEAPTLADVEGECSAEASVPSANDNCEGAIQGTTSDPLSYSTQGTHVIHWSFDDGNGNVSYADQNVIIDDVTEPSISCPSNIVLSACQSTASWSVPVATDNCSGAVVTQTSGPPSGSEFANGTTTTIGYKVTDVGGNEKTCSFTVTRQNTLSVTCSNSNNVLYYGYTGDQTSTITVNPTGGVGPYTVSITMNRPLMCNVITNSGDEVWIPGANTSTNSGISCPTSGSPTVNPISTSTNTIISSLGYSINVTLMADATFTATVTDANGCTVTCTTPVFAEDVRCFAGNSGVPKVKLCHKTGSAKNPCVNICVDESAVAEHMAHGDFFGNCTSNCQPAGGNTRPEVVFDVIAYPNPTNNQFTFEIETESAESISIELYDISGRLVRQIKDRDQTVITFGEDLPRGLYLAVVYQGTEQKTLRVIKE